MLCIFSEFCLGFPYDYHFNYLSTQHIGTVGSDEGISLDMTIYGDYYCSGLFSQTVDLDPTNGVSEHTSKGVQDIFSIKFRSTP